MIVIEGTDGVGRSTHIALLRTWLESRGHAVLDTGMTRSILAGRGINARVLNLATVRPIDEEAVIAAARETGAIVTAEEHSIFGGLGSAVAEVVVDNAPVPMKRLGVPGVYAPTGSAEFLLDEFGMAPAAIADAAQALIKRK